MLYRTVASVVQRNGSSAPFARPCFRLIPALFVCLSEPSQNSLVVIRALTASILKVAVNHSASHRPLSALLLSFYTQIN
ncbi:MAG: hypothetical protein VB110_01935 [Bacteroidales bacterium]|nr:hypothetical protein [Bacteroidales bacterium]